MIALPPWVPGLTTIAAGLLLAACAAPDPAPPAGSAPALPAPGAEAERVEPAPAHAGEDPSQPVPRPPVPVVEPSEALCEAPAFSPRTREPALEPEQRRVLTRYLAQHSPAELRAAGTAGRVVLWVCFDAQGQVRNTRVEESSGNPEFDRVAQEALRRVRYTPALNREQPVPAWVQIPIPLP